MCNVVRLGVFVCSVCVGVMFPSGPLDLFFEEPISRKRRSELLYVSAECLWVIWQISRVGFSLHGLALAILTHLVDSLHRGESARPMHVLRIDAIKVLTPPLPSHALIPETEREGYNGE